MVVSNMPEGTVKMKRKGLRITSFALMATVLMTGCGESDPKEAKVTAVETGTTQAYEKPGVLEPNQEIDGEVKLSEKPTTEATTAVDTTEATEVITESPTTEEEINRTVSGNSGGSSLFGKMSGSIGNKTSEISVPEGSVYFNGHMYKIYWEAMDWSDAKEFCEQKNGHLATITSEEEQEFLRELSGSDTKLWIGGYRPDDAFDWHWVTGEEWDYTAWGDGEPNNDDDVIANENRVAMWKQNWNDLNEKSRQQTGFICEWDTGGPDIAADSTEFTVLNGASYYDGHFYKIRKDAVDWSDAETLCEKQKGHLVTITSAEEQAFIEQLNSDDLELWIGGYLTDDSAAWLWITGEAWEYTNWDDGEPNNSNSEFDVENRASIRPEEQKWNDLNEKSRKQVGFICEWE